MEKCIFPLGTIIRIADMQFMIAGYTWGERADKKILKYAALPYPQGLTEKNGILTVSEDVFEVVSIGFRNEAYEILAGFYGTIRDIAKECSADEMDQYLQKAAKIAKERGFI